MFSESLDDWEYISVTLMWEQYLGRWNIFDTPSSKCCRSYSTLFQNLLLREKSNTKKIFVS